MGSVSVPRVLVLSQVLGGVNVSSREVRSPTHRYCVVQLPENWDDMALKALCFAIATRNRYSGGDEYSTAQSSDSNSSRRCHHSLLTSVPHDCIPFLEIDLVVQDDDDGSRSCKRDPQLPLLSTHIPYTSLPKSIVESPGCKIVYIWRDPKDTFVSFLYFRKKVIENAETKQKFCFDIEFDRFCEGKLSYGPFWDHVLGFWNASLECPDRVLFLKYEDMKKDTLYYIKRLADFLNQPFSEEEENEGVPQKIMELCGFHNLSSLEVNNTGKHRAQTSIEINNSVFFRKGEVGDWKNRLTMEMTERIDAITIQKFDGSGLQF